MNEPNTPDDSRGWDAIDIFLFSNGQQYSPPRKYHLKADDLKCWHQTKTFLARSQYGSMHSAIDLYTLDGKKIEGPLELRNAAAYVAVEPPDAFIPAGYEKYLIKASRSREKRQEKLSNSNQIETTGKKGMVLDITTIEQIEGIIALTMAENSVTDTANTKQLPEMLERPTFPKLNSTNKGNDKLHQKKKSNDSEGSPIFKKKNFSSSKKNNASFMKLKNEPLKPQKCCNKQQVITPKYFKTSKIPTRGNSSEYKASSRTSNLPSLKLIKESILNPEMSHNQNYKKENDKKNSDKDVPVFTNIYKNNDSDVQSVLAEIARKTTIDNNSTKTLIEINKDNKHLIQEQNQGHMVLVDNKGKLNIQLRIKLEDFSSSMTSENRLPTDKSVITLIKKEMASQVNIDVILGKDIFAYNNRLILNGKSVESGKNVDNTCNEEASFVRCSYDSYIPTHNDLNDPSFKNALDFPIETNEILESCCKCKLNQEKIEMVDKGIQKSISTSNNIVLNPNEAVTEKLENITIQDDCTGIKPNNQTDFENNTIYTNTEVPAISAKAFDDKFVQTEWCNVLLQAKRHEDGRYTFHLPPLSLLKQYDLNQK